MKTAMLLLALSLTACSHDPTIGPVRFHNVPIVWEVDDRAPLDTKPEERNFHRRLVVLETSIVERLDRTFAVPDRPHAKNVNALDEVPDSSWFDNRLLRGLTPAQIRVGPTAESAENLRPWKVRSTKTGGKHFGLAIADSRGQEYILKFDVPGHPELKSATDVVVSRLLWALGYHVAADDVVEFERSDLILEPDAVEKLGNNELPLTEERFEEMLADVERDGDRFRGLVSKIIPGEPIGGYSREGVREDDPNDRVEHEHRRDLRGQFLFFAWVDHTDWKEDNRVDMWIPNENGTGHVEHYLVDFDKSLGVMAVLAPRDEDGYVYSVDAGYAFLSLASFGLWMRPWERLPLVDEWKPRRGVGRFESIVFDPELWRPRLDETAFAMRDRFDDFWAAKRMMMLSKEQIRAAVQAGRYSDPIAEQYVYDTLLARRDKIARWAFERVTPLDRFQVFDERSDFALCFDDLWLTNGYADSAQTTYRFRQYDEHGRLLSKHGAPADDGSPTACTRKLAPARGEDGYTIVAVDLMRGGLAFDPVEVHLARSPQGTLRIIGIVRPPPG
jgi:hypothetical protein